MFSKNKNSPFNNEDVNYWMPVDQYIGGIGPPYYTCCTQFFRKGINSLNNKINFSEPFKNLFTQGMVCHESYKDEKGDWLYPHELKR